MKTIKKLSIFIKRSILKLKIKPIKSFEILNGFFDLGIFIRNHQDAKLFTTKFLMYDFLNSDVLKNEPINYIEFGVFKGETLFHWSKINDNPNSEFYGFDSFEGLPEDWLEYNTLLTKGTFSTDGQIPITDDKRIQFIKGWFQDSLIPFLADHAGNLKRNRLVLHFDADLYSSELFCLTRMFDFMQEGTIMIFDDFSVTNHDFRALKNFTESHLIDYKVISLTIPKYDQAALEITKKRTYYR